VTLATIEQWLSDRLGLNVDSMGPGVVQAAIARCMEERGVRDIGAFAQQVQQDSATWQALVDLVTVQETWFFRDGEPFRFLVKWIEQQGLAARRIRCLSCPCASGEEPYSISMTLLDHGFVTGQFTVDAGDISAGALASAARGVFRERSVRTVKPIERQSYFTRTESGAYRLRSDVRDTVSFHRMNLLRSDGIGGGTPYDVIFCRNLLIYLHPEGQTAVFSRLNGLLAEPGLLIVGHAEAGLVRPYGFRPAGPASAFAFERARLPDVAAVQP